MNEQKHLTEDMYLDDDVIDSTNTIIDSIDKLQTFYQKRIERGLPLNPIHEMEMDDDDEDLRW